MWNSEFFDDVDGAEFDRLVESIKDHGLHTPLWVTESDRARVEYTCDSSGHRINERYLDVRDKLCPMSGSHHYSFNRINPLCRKVHCGLVRCSDLF